MRHPMIIKRLFETLRHHIALHATLEVKMFELINNATRDLVRLGEPMGHKIKLRGTTGEGIEVYVDIELIGESGALDKFHFAIGKHVGLVMRTID